MAFCGTGSSSAERALAPSPESFASLSPRRLDLERVLRDNKARNQLIQAMAKSEERKSSVRPVRFCIAADEYYQLKSALDRKQKARKMVGVFVQNGSMFQLADLPQEMQALFFKEKFQVIAQAREHYSKQLAEDEHLHLTIAELGLL